VLPDAHHAPADVLEELVDFTVSLGIALELRSPIPTVRVRDRPVLRTYVPEAAVHKDSETMSRKGDVDGHKSTGSNLSEKLLPKSEAAAMQLGSQAQLWLGIGLPIRAHDRGCARTGGQRVTRALGHDSTIPGADLGVTSAAPEQLH
jgi:hypothetical protein